MRILADESVDMAVVRALRAAGHDVLAIAELEPSITDDRVVELARSEQRLLVSEDKDFGRFLDREGSPGTLLLRFDARARSAIGQAVVDLVAEHGAGLHGRFVVVEPGRARFHPR